MMGNVSVIIPFYQAERWIDEAIRSCIAQSSFIKEVIAVDDFSTDGGWDLARGFEAEYPGWVKVIKNQTKGGNNARNLGLSLSSGDYIQWLDSDDVLLAGKLQAQLSYFDQHPDTDIVYSDWQLDTYNPGGELERTEYKKAKRYGDYTAELLKDNWLPPHCYLLKRDVAIKNPNGGSWNPVTSVGQDREYFTNIALAGARFAYVPGNFCIYNRRRLLKSVSQALKMKERTAHVNKMLYDFIDRIQASGTMAHQLKEKYRKILLTQILFASVIYHHPVDTRQFSFRNIDWSLIKGTRSRIKVALKLLFN